MTVLCPSAPDIMHLFCVQKAGLEFGAAHSYLSLEKLGEGAFASVYKGISRSDSPQVSHDIKDQLLTITFNSLDIYFIFFCLLTVFKHKCFALSIL